MLSQNVLKKRVSVPFLSIFSASLLRREIHHDGRNRLSNIFVPTQRKSCDPSEPENGHDLLVRAGFLRQAYSGIFHLLPLGLRVQNKIEKLIDKHMQRLGASKVSLSSISSEELWQRSGRLDKGRTSELLQLEDRKGAKYLLSPTHEEEITTIIANAVHSYKELPLRLYQVSRKYRDEPRPRQGLLRGREFLMKDLYTFDVTEVAARETYEEVRKAYVGFLEDLKLPFLVAQADSGNMGGTLSHEYHFASHQGEDTIIKCDKCDYSINEELYVGRYDPNSSPATTNVREDEFQASKPTLSSRFASEYYVSKDRTKLCSIHYLAEHGEPNIYAIKAIFPEIDTGLQGERATKEHKTDVANGASSHIHYRDPRVSNEELAKDAGISLEAAQNTYAIPTIDGEPILLTKLKTGDACPGCREGKVQLLQAVEIGHTFHLGQRYSVPLEAHVLDANNRNLPIEMGCHGIGVSRIIGAVAALLADSKGLNWPLSISPFDVVVIPGSKTDLSEVETVYDMLSMAKPSQNELDVVLDDRDKAIGWKLNDADLVGYPFIVVMGNAWRDRRSVELQCRRLGVNVEVHVDKLAARILEDARKL